MFFNSANNGFPFQMPFMNGQMPQFQMPNMNGQTPYQMPFMNGQMPFPMPFMFPFGMNMNPNQNQTDSNAAADETQSAPQGFNPFGFFQMPNMNSQTPYQMPFMNGQMPFPMPFMFPFGMNMNQSQTDSNAAADETQSAPQGFNPFGFFQMPNMNGQTPYQMPFMNGQMPFMNGQMLFMMPFMFPFSAMQMQPEQIKDQWSKMFSMFGIGEKKENGLPFDIPTDLLQFLLHMDSTPEGLSKFQKILDFIFEEYTKACTKEDTSTETEADAE